MHCRNFSDTNTASFVSVRRIEQCNVLGVILRSFNKEREAEGEISRRLRSRRTNVSCRYCTKMSNTALKTNPTTKPTTYQCYISLFLEDRRRLTSEKRLNSEIWCELTPGGGFCCFGLSLRHCRIDFAFTLHDGGGDNLQFALSPARRGNSCKSHSSSQLVKSRSLNFIGAVSCSFRSSSSEYDHADKLASFSVWLWLAARVASFLISSWSGNTPSREVTDVGLGVMRKRELTASQLAFLGFSVALEAVGLLVVSWLEKNVVTPVASTSTPSLPLVVILSAP